MSSKKKPAAKSKPAPGPLLKLKFEKFPDKQVPVFFEVSKLCFYADFGFEQYEAASVAQLKQKITAAIKNGATPQAVWVPMIYISIDVQHGRTGYKQSLDLQFDVDIEREYFCIGRGGKLLGCDWGIPEKSRNSHTHDTYGAVAQMKPKNLNAPIYKTDRNSWDGGRGVDALVPYTEQLWTELGEQIRELRAQAAGLIHHVAAGKLEVFTNFIFDFEQHGRAQVAPQKKPAEPKKVLGKSFRQVREETSVTDPVAKLTSFVNAGRAAQEAVDQAIANYKPPAARKSKPKITFSGAEVHFDGKTIELTPGPLPGSIRIPLLKHYPQMQSAHVLKDGRVQLVVGIMASDKPVYLSIDQLQQKLNKQPGPIAELFENGEPARKDKELVNA